MQPEHTTSDRIFFDLRIRWPKSSDFGPKSFDLGHQIFKSIVGMVSKFEMLSTTARSSRTFDELDGDTAVQRRCFAPDARSARLSVAKLQSAGAGSGLETKRSALGAHLFVDTYS